MDDWKKHGQSYRAQTWDGSRLVSEVGSLSLDAAREVARSAKLTGCTGRVAPYTESGRAFDYWEVYPVDGPPRFGTFAEVTLVTVQEPTGPTVHHAKPGTQAL